MTTKAPPRRLDSVAGKAVFLAAFLIGALPSGAMGQELVPAAYTPAPTGVNLVTLAAGISSGDLTFDPSLPVEEATARITLLSAGYARTFGLFGRASSLTLIAPYLDGHLEGRYIGEQTSVDRSGLGDAVVRFGINLSGAPAMGLAEFRDYRPGTLIGASLIVKVPTGQYDPSKLINIGANRWGFKPEVGIVQVLGKWALDAYVGGWFFTDNPDFYGGRRRTQDPIVSTQFHVTYRAAPNLWAALNGNFWRGGTTRVDGQANDDLQRNSRVGLTVAWQVAPRHGVRLAGSLGAFTRIGGNFEALGLSYSYSWF